MARAYRGVEVADVGFGQRCAMIGCRVFPWGEPAKAIRVLDKCLISRTTFNVIVLDGGC